MRQKRRKNKLTVVPVSEERESDYLFDEIMKVLEPGVKTVNRYGANYVHENPWTDDCCWDARIARDALYRVGIGAIGRINKCEHAIRLGLLPKVSAPTRCFTSMALYDVYRVARLVQREYVYVRNFEAWINNWMSETVVNSRRLEYEGVVSGPS